MSYSSAIFPSWDTPLLEASFVKMERVCRKLELGPGDHLLEIGSGWGGLAIHAASWHGCRVTTTTISPKQYELAAERIERAGLSDRVELLLCDYRDLEGRYDKTRLDRDDRGRGTRVSGRVFPLLQPATEARRAHVAARHHDRRPPL